MKSSIGVVGALVASVALIGVASAQAAPAQVRLDGHVQIVDPYWVQIGINYRCDGNMELVANVQQPSDRAGGSYAYIGSYLEVACTGRWEHITINLHYPTFEETGFVAGWASANVAAHTYGSETYSEIFVEKKVRIS